MKFSKLPQALLEAIIKGTVKVKSTEVKDGTAKAEIEYDEVVVLPGGGTRVIEIRHKGQLVGTMTLTPGDSCNINSQGVIPLEFDGEE